ncbi:MAG TPA: hypothetical protein VFL92_11925 [Sphingomonas sp.]|nr:hypothetical protein [Sphingomonas sp.]
MTPEEDRRARDRFAVLSGLRAGGVVLMVIGIWMWLGGSFAGSYGFGSILFVVGVIGGILIPALLVRRWRTPPR